jgi:hypothetical protein
VQAASEFFKKTTEALHLVRDPVLPQRVPVGSGIDGDHRLSQPSIEEQGIAKKRR